MGLDVKTCCRLCLKDAASEQATHIDLQQQQEVGELVKNLYGFSIKYSDRGSNLVCVPCYKDATKLKKHIDVHRAKTNLVSLNQAILNSQAVAFPEEDEPESVGRLDFNHMRLLVNDQNGGQSRHKLFKVRIGLSFRI
ncbi:uncharacterized protein LOC131696115 [Topomyia yanbarensis]|uniref:uncharacterized protein LOC131696115 n=1 Tax=Topomyia yanbarensis TaxID=2498891 RepID=UPI00273ADF9F|nr:uncharacterized protein LOC131696115 [Topomyia yanbarensis]